jgi:hypothetical protein
MKITVLDNEFITIWVYPGKKIIHHKFKKFAYGDAFKEIMLKAAEAFKQNGCTKWLSDDLENSALASADRDWAYQVWGPKVLDSGWKHWAILFPKKIVGQMNMKKIVEQYTNMGINVKLFSDLGSSMEWLEKQ